MEQVKKCFVESPQTAESSCHSNFGHWHAGFMNELFREKHSPCLRNRDGRRSKVLKEQAT